MADPIKPTTMLTDDEALVEQAAQAIHTYCSRNMIMTYLDADEDCTGIARAIIPIIRTTDAARIKALEEGCRALIAWDDAEKVGPDYGTLTRDTHPEGETIWREWWDRQQRLCQHAFDSARTALAGSNTNADA